MNEVNEEIKESSSPIALSEEKPSEQLEVFSAEPIKRPKKKKGFPLIIVLIILVVLVTAIAGYYFLFMQKINPESIFESSIESVYKYTSDIFNKLDMSNIQNKMTIDLDAKAESSNSELDMFTDLNYNLKFGVDASNRRFIAGLKMIENNSTLVDASLLVKTNMYLKTSLFSKVINLGNDYVSYLDELFDTLEKNEDNIDSLIYVINASKDIIINSLDSSKMTMTKVDKTIDGVNYNVNKITYTLDEENMRRTLSYFNEKILSDDKLIDSLSKLLDSDREDIIESLKDDIDLSDYETTTISVYIDKNNKFIAADIIQSEEILTCTYVDETLKLKIKDEEEMLDLTVKDNNIDIEVDEYGSIVKANIHYEEDNVKASVYYNDGEDSVTVTIDLTNVLYDENGASFDYVTNIQSESESVKLSGKCKVSYEFSDFDYNNSVKIEELTDDDINEIMNNIVPLLDKFGLNNLLTYETEA